jgi:hypothetical protein
MNRPAIEALYVEHCASGSAMAAHLPRLRELATDCDLAVEFGVKRGASTTALLLGAQRVLSYDILATPQAKALERLAGDGWTYRLADSRTAKIPSCDLLLVDSLHTYAQVKAELDAHADTVQRYLIFHDTITFGSIGADGETGRHLWTYTPGHSVPTSALGIRPAIDELMMRDPTWRILSHATLSHGLLVLARPWM